MVEEQDVAVQHIEKQAEVINTDMEAASVTFLPRTHDRAYWHDFYNEAQLSSKQLWFQPKVPALNANVAASFSWWSYVSEQIDSVLPRLS